MAQIGGNNNISQKMKNLIKDAVEQMFSIIGITVKFKDLKGTWWNRYSMTKANKETLKTWFVDRARTDLGWGTEQAEQEFEYFFQDYGLRLR